MKTPVSILSEQLRRRKITPCYELVQIEGARHEPTFRYRVSFNYNDIPYTAEGAGSSKKKAKNAAAKALIEELIGTTLPWNDTNYEDNPVKSLREPCTARRYPPPTYETKRVAGLPAHERHFSISCTMSKYREVGKGKSRKVAKRLAAQKMIRRLRKHPLNRRTRI